MKVDFDFNNLFFPFIPDWILKLIMRIPEWKTDYNVALAEAKQNKKVVFALFTGSDWCSYCIYLHKEVLTSPLFLSWASKRVVLLMIDFPKYTKLPPNLSKQNQMLKNKYKVTGYPTAIGLNPDGIERGRSNGYSPGTGPKGWLIQFETNAKMNQSPTP